MTLPAIYSVQCGADRQRANSDQRACGTQRAVPSVQYLACRDKRALNGVHEMTYRQCKMHRSQVVSAGPVVTIVLAVKSHKTHTASV